jgi:hypothetical protein
LVQTVIASLGSSGVCTARQFDITITNDPFIIMLPPFISSRDTIHAIPERQASAAQSMRLDSRADTCYIQLTFREKAAPYRGIGSGCHVQFYAYPFARLFDHPAQFRKHSL